MTNGFCNSYILLCSFDTCVLYFLTEVGAARKEIPFSVKNIKIFSYTVLYAIAILF